MLAENTKEDKEKGHTMLKKHILYSKISSLYKSNLDI
jgi:hypothetical protein